MKVIKTISSPDGLLTLQIQVADDGSTSIGFIGGEWHTHTDLISSWLKVKEENAIEEFINQVIYNKLPIITSIDGGVSFEPWVSDNHAATVKYYGNNQCIARYWTTNRPIQLSD